MSMSAVMACALSKPDTAYETYKTHFGNGYVDTESVIVSTLRLQYPSLKLISCDASIHNLIGFAEAGKATCTILDTESHRAIRRVGHVSRKPAEDDIQEGYFVDDVKFGRYLYECCWKTRSEARITQRQIYERSYWVS